MRIAHPALPEPLETALPLEQALALCAAQETPVQGCAFTGGSAAGLSLEKTEYHGCTFHGCHFTEARLSGAWMRDLVLENCDLSGARLMDATLQRVCLRGCKLSGANFSAALLADVVLQDCVAEGAVFSEAAFRHVLFERVELSGAAFWDVRPRSVFRLAACRLVRAEFLHTSLNGQDLRDCELSGARFSGEDALRGAKVSPVQACELARLLGVVIE